jgi:hypothetical protein
LNYRMRPGRDLFVPRCWRRQAWPRSTCRSWFPRVFKPRTGRHMAEPRPLTRFELLREWELGDVKDGGGIRRRPCVYWLRPARANERRPEVGAKSRRLGKSLQRAAATEMAVRGTLSAGCVGRAVLVARGVDAHRPEPAHLKGQEREEQDDAGAVHDLEYPTNSEVSANPSRLTHKVQRRFVKNCRRNTVPRSSSADVARILRGRNRL